MADNVDSDRGPRLLIASIVMVAVAILFVGSRVLYRGYSKKLGWDDLTISLSLVRLNFNYAMGIKTDCQKDLLSVAHSDNLLW